MIACLQAAVHSAGYFGIHTVALAHIAAYTQYGIQADVCAAFVPADIIGQVEQVVQLDAALFQLIVEAAQQRHPVGVE